MSLVSFELQLSTGRAEISRCQGDGPPVVLLHGACGNGTTFAPVVPAWAWADLSCPSLPGRVGSEGAPLAEVFALAAWLGEVLDALEASGQAAPVLVGHSLGGAVALALALSQPARLAGLVLVSSGSRLRVAPAILQAAEGATDEMPFTLDLAFGPETPPAVVQRYNRDAAGTPQAACLADWRACDGFDVRARLGEVHTPTLVVYGTQDAFTPQMHQRRLVEALPNATQHVVEGAGHMLPWEAPEAVAEAVAEAVRGWRGRQV